MKRTFTIFILSLVGFVASASAQEVTDSLTQRHTPTFTERLAEPDGESGARAQVVIHQSAQEAMGKYNAQTSPKEFYQGYRIRIFASHTQSARTDAEAAIALFQENYNVPVYFAYENPYFLVTCGNCLTQDEAIMLLSKVRIHFPKAFIVTCEIPASALTTKPAPKPTEEEVSESATEESAVVDSLAVE